MALHQVNILFNVSDTKTSRFHFDLETPVSLTQAEYQDIADAVQAEFATHLALWSDSIFFGLVEIFGFQRAGAGTPADPYYRERNTAVFFSAASIGFGTDTTPNLPSNCAFVVSFRTNQAGRRFNGRTYTPPPPEDVVGDSNLVTDANTRVTAIKETVEAAEAAIAPVDVDHIVYSLKYDEQAEVVVYKAGSRIDTQRRRLQKTPG